MPDTVTRRFGGWLPVKVGSTHASKQSRVKLTWNWVAVETLYLVLRCRSVVQQVSNTVRAFEWVTVPSDRGRRAIEFGKVHGPCRRVVRGVIQTSKLVCSTGRDFDAVGISGAGCGANETYSYSSRVRVLILFESAPQIPRLICLDTLDTSQPKREGITHKHSRSGVDLWLMSSSNGRHVHANPPLPSVIPRFEARLAELLAPILYLYVGADPERSHPRPAGEQAR